MHPQLLDAPAAAALFVLKLQAVRQALDTGQIPGVKIGREWRIWAPAAVERILGPQAMRELTSPPPGHVEPGAVTVAELSMLLGLHEKTTSRLLRDGALPGQKVGATWRVYCPQIREHIAAGQAPAA